MRNTYRNAIILAVAIGFTALGFAGATAEAQTKSAKPTPMPKTKKSPAVTAKTTPKPKPKSSATPATKTATTKKPTTKTPTKTTTAKNKNTASKPEKTANKVKTTVAAKPTPTPKPTAKPVKPTPKDTPKSAAEQQQVIVSATDSRIRQQPKANAAQVSVLKLGKTLNVEERNGTWYRVEYEKGKSGWISKTTVKDYENDRRDDIYSEIANRYSKSKSLDFANAAEVYEFLRTAQAMVRKDDLKADLGLKRLRVLSAALKTIPSGKGEQFPYKNFLKANEKDVVYSEPSGEWYVRSDMFWDLHSKFTALPVAEEIAWEAAQNPIPGECEGYVNCYLYLLRATSGEYLNFYPNGKYSKKALSNVTNMLEPIVADVNAKTVYAPPTDISDRAEFNRFLTELRTIISKMPDVDKARTLQQINRLGEGYK